jgi:predicted transcriptional regulator
LVTAYLEGGLDFPVCVGWGCASNVIDAHRNAQRAAKEALLCNGSTAFVVTADNVIIGPLSSVRRISYNDAPNQRIAKLSGRVSISPLYISKIMSVLNQKGSDTLSSEELAFYLNITTRSASRILAKLEAGGAAVVQYNRQLNLRGRPTKIYKVDFRDSP